MKLNFSKMHGAGNDFVVIDCVRQSVPLSPGKIRFIADRHRGVGCDQVLLVEPPDHPDADFRYRIYNADGSEAGQCGNGARCFARFVREQRLSGKRELKVQTTSGMMQLKTLEDGRVLADLGTPKFQPIDIPLIADAPASQYTLEVEGSHYQVGALSMGNPHVVLQVENCNDAAVETLGPQLERHPRFPERVNVGFMQVVSRSEIKLRVYERGAGETQACGSGACAAAVHGMRLGLLDHSVTVQLPGGKLTVSWLGDDAPVWLGGPTANVFQGSIKLRN
jgi:diaminopimelate epimerase